MRVDPDSLLIEGEEAAAAEEKKKEQQEAKWAACNLRCPVEACPYGAQTQVSINRHVRQVHPTMGHLLTNQEHVSHENRSRGIVNAAVESFKQYITDPSNSQIMSNFMNDIGERGGRELDLSIDMVPKRMASAVQEELTTFQKDVAECGSWKNYVDQKHMEQNEEDFAEMEEILMEQYDEMKKVDVESFQDLEYNCDISDGELEEIANIYKTEPDLLEDAPIEYQEEDSSKRPQNPPSEEEFLALREMFTFKSKREDKDNKWAAPFVPDFEDFEEEDTPEDSEGKEPANKKVKQ